MISAGSQVYGGMAENAQAKYQSRLAEQNAQIEERNRVDAISRGETAQMQRYRKLAQDMGEARAKNAAAGIDVNFGSAADFESDLAMIGYEDSATIAENTNKEVMGYDISAANYRSEGQAAKMRGKAAVVGGGIGAFGTLLSSASQIASSNVAKGNNWYGGPKG